MLQISRVVVKDARNSQGAVVFGHECTTNFDIASTPENLHMEFPYLSTSSVSLIRQIINPVHSCSFTPSILIGRTPQMTLRPLPSDIFCHPTLSQSLATDLHRPRFFPTIHIPNTLIRNSCLSTIIDDLAPTATNSKLATRVTAIFGLYQLQHPPAAISAIPT